MRQLTQNVRRRNGKTEKKGGKDQNKVRTPHFLLGKPKPKPKRKRKFADDAVAAVELVSLGCPPRCCGRRLLSESVLLGRYLWACLCGPSWNAAWQQNTKSWNDKNCWPSSITWPLEICILMASPAFGTTYPQLCGVAAEEPATVSRRQGCKEHGQRMATICVKCCCRGLMMPRITNTHLHIQWEKGIKKVANDFDF